MKKVNMELVQKNNKECNSIINNILVETKTILQRNNKRHNEKLMSFWLDFGIELDKMNEDMEECLTSY